MSANDIWTANKFLKNPAGDGGLPRIPSLKTTNETNNNTHMHNNTDKALLFAKAFSPPPPINTPLTTNFKAIIDLKSYYNPWKEFIMVVLRKPSKPNYETPKAYRPIALISTMAKLLTSIIAENLSRIVEQHHILPKNHFGGRPGQSTSDAIHYLISKIHAAWNKNKVASVLFLDVEGAFPNAVTARLIHNLKKRRIPNSIVNFVKQLLTNRSTRLKFNDYLSDPIPISNGIGQGDPLSMILYILYNADLLETPLNQINEDAIGYVDNIAVIAIGENFDDTTNRLKNLMMREDRGLEWSRSHNSKFKVNKSAVMHFTRKTTQDPDTNKRIPIPSPNLIIKGQTVNEVKSYKCLGILINNKLNWKEQAQRATAKVTNWILQFRRLTKLSTGVKLKLMHQLYLAVALPKIAYGLDTVTPSNILRYYQAYRFRVFKFLVFKEFSCCYKEFIL